MSLMSLVMNMDKEDGDDSDIVFDFRSSGDEGTDKEAIKKAINEYVNERLREVAIDYKVAQQLETD